MLRLCWYKIKQMGKTGGPFLGSEIEELLPNWEGLGLKFPTLVLSLAFHQSFNCTVFSQSLALLLPVSLVGLGVAPLTFFSFLHFFYSFFPPRLRRLSLIAQVNKPSSWANRTEQLSERVEKRQEMEKGIEAEGEKSIRTAGERVFFFLGECEDGG